MERFGGKEHSAPWPGIDIAFVGMDGAGKSTLSRALTERLREDGHVVADTVWQDYLTPTPTTFLHELYSDLFVQLAQALYGSAILADGRPAATILPPTKSGFLEPGFLSGLSRLTLRSNDPMAIAAAGYIELAGALMFQELVTRPALERGNIVVQESHGLRSLLKFSLLADAAARNDAASKNPLASALGPEVIGRLVPTLCVFVAGDPQTARRRRLSQAGTLGALEHFGLSGQGNDTFVSFQTALQVRLEALASEYKWIRVPMSDAPFSTAVDQGVERILEDPRFRAWSARSTSIRTQQ